MPASRNEANYEWIIVSYHHVADIKYWFKLLLVAVYTLRVCLNRLTANYKFTLVK